MLPLRAFLAIETLTPISSGSFCIAKSSPLPRSTVLTACFSPRPPPALEASCLRLGCPGLIPALMVAVLRTLELAWVEEALAWRVDEPPQMGCPPSAHGGKGPAGGEGGCRGDPMPCTLLNNGALIYRAPGFFWKRSQLWSFFLLSLGLSLHSQQLSPPWVHTPTPTFQHPAPFCIRRHITQDVVHRASGIDHVCSSYFVLPSTDRLLHFPLSPQRFPFCPSWLPHHGWAFPRVGTSPHCQFPTSGAGLLPFPLVFLFLFFFILTGPVRIFLILLGVRGLPLVFSWGFLRTVFHL